MILVGNQRGHSADLAAHLMSADNEHVQVHELRGFVSETLAGALNESYAVSKGTRCRQHLFSLSLNPPATAEVSTEDFEAAIGRVEKTLGLQDQPRAIVFHEKRGAGGELRRHCHAVWSRIDADEMKAVHLPFTKRRLMDVSRDLYIHHGWEMPRGLMNKNERNPLNFTHAQWQQAKRIGKDPKAIKQAFRDAWAQSDSKNAFIHALAECGYHVARGDRRGFVAVDTITDEVFAIAKWTGVKTRDVRARLGDEDALPSITETRAGIARRMLPLMRKFADEVDGEARRHAGDYRQARRELAQTQKRKRRHLAQTHEKRREQQRQALQARFRTGIKGLWDRLRGEHKRIQKQNETEAATAAKQDQAAKTRQTTGQLAERRELRQDAAQKRVQAATAARDINADIRRFNDMAAQNPQPQRGSDHKASRAAYKQRRARATRRSKTRSRNGGPEHGL